VNLKWNVDGEGRVKPPPEYANFLKAKRSEFIWLGVTSSSGAVLLGCIASVVCEGYLSFTTLQSIVAYNLVGFASGALISYLA